MYLGLQGQRYRRYDRDDPQAVTEYINDIMSYFRVIEGERPSPSYMSKQSHQRQNESNLGDWFAEAHLGVQPMLETFTLTINLIDRFLEKKVVVRQRPAVVTCMLWPQIHG